MVKIVIPVADEKGERVSAHFGRAPYYGWYQVDGGKIVDRGVAPNDSSHFGGQGLPPERMMALGAEVVISGGMGMKAIQMFQNSTVAVLQAVNESTEQSIKDFIDGKLRELTEGCLHAEKHGH
ncbi:MAG: NifB/NifX family molybdenum-iron cluster-binding protein [Candidatus Bathyarchaeota archaeon]|nr:NifB/NifX family molybdenum-iron cluster-binding protein [Candidatus Bathyarchaeota archaeon]